MLPFSEQQFLDVFARYNESVWPAQIILLMLGIALLGSFAKKNANGRVLSLGVALLWLWPAVAYHLFFFAAINPAAALFALLFATGAALFVIQGGVHGRLAMGRPHDAFGAAGIALMLYAIIGYPLVAWLAGHPYPAVPTFGLPCPVTLFSVGFIAACRRPVPRVLLVPPLLWSVIALVAAVQFGMIEDYALIVAVIVTVALFVRDMPSRLNATVTSH